MTYKRVLSSLLDENYQSNKGQYHESAKIDAEHCKVRPPECLSSEAEHRKDRRSWDLDVDSVLRYKEESAHQADHSC